MLYLRQYKTVDADVILSWCKDEREFRKWTADRYPHYPVTAQEMNYKYVDCNGDCAEPDNFYPMTACDEDGPVGHFIMRYTDMAHKTLRLGFVIVDSQKRCCGYGRQMIVLALDYAFRISGADTVTIGVFDNNEQAYRCYTSAGFTEVSVEQQAVCNVLGEQWKVVEMAISRDEYLNR